MKTSLDLKISRIAAVIASINAEREWPSREIHALSMLGAEIIRNLVVMNNEDVHFMHSFLAEVANGLKEHNRKIIVEMEYLFCWKELKWINNFQMPALSIQRYEGNALNYPRETIGYIIHSNHSGFITSWNVLAYGVQSFRDALKD